MTVPLRIQLGGAPLAAPVVADICHLYDKVFSRPPFYWRPDESQLHRDRLNRLLGDPSFGVALAWADKELLGFAYGFGVAADTTRWSRLVEPLPEQLTAEWPGRTFLLFDFAVAEAHRGQGLGRRLHDTLLGSRDEQRATLTVEPTAIDTKAIYERWGWRKVGQLVGGPTAAAPLFDVYLRESLADLRSAQRMPDEAS